MDRQGMKTIAVWLALVLMLVGAYRLSGEWSFIRSLGFVVVGIGVLAILGTLAGKRPWIKMSNEALENFNRGHFGKALELWSAAAVLAPRAPAPRFNCGAARVSLWQLSKAREDFEAVTREKKYGKNEQLRALALPQLMLIAALEGRIEDAKKLREEVTALKQPIAPQANLADAVIDIREGRITLGHMRLRSSEIKQLNGTLGAMVAALDAWCIKLEKGETRHVDKIALYGEASSDGLKTAWPEFNAFLESAPQA